MTNTNTRTKNETSTTTFAALSLSHNLDMKKGNVVKVPFHLNLETKSISLMQNDSVSKILFDTVCLKVLVV